MMEFAVGVVGDPNSGKSVLTYILYKAGLARGYNVFRQEGDVASPTGPWYLEALADPERARRAEEARRALKAAWDERKAEWVARSVRTLKSTGRLVLVDMGGGRPPVERVTRENSIILREVDAVVIVCPKETAVECFEAWERELAERAPHVKVLAKCVSDLDGDDSVFDPENSVCVLSGLDRRRAVKPPPHLIWAAERMMDYIYTALRSG